MSKLVSNLERRMRVWDITQKALALKAGLNETAVRDILKGRSKDPQYTTLNSIARVFGCTIEDLYSDPAKIKKYGLSDRPAAWPGDVGVAADDAGGSDTDGLVIHELDIASATTPGAMTDGRSREVVATWQIPAGAVDGFSGKTVDLKIIRVQGDSMAPDFLPGDRVLVDTSDRVPSPPGVFLLWDGMGFILRRCETRPNAKPPVVVLRARNPEYSAHEMPLKDVTIAGRVVGKWQKV